MLPTDIDGGGKAEALPPKKIATASPLDRLNDSFAEPVFNTVADAASVAEALPTAVTSPVCGLMKSPLPEDPVKSSISN